MSAIKTDIPGKGKFARGIHPNDKKAFAADAAIEVIPTPSQVLIPMLQHVGAPCAPLTKPKQQVALGEVIGDCEAFISAPVHATVNGVAQMPSVATLANGRHVQAIPIKAEGDQLAGAALFADIFGGDWPKKTDNYSPEQIADAVRKAGIVGLGGAAFPTHVKVRRNDKKPIDALLLNGCECEPYLTADYRLMLEAPAPIITGALLAAKACGAERIIIAVEDNKPAAVEALRDAAAGTNMTIAAVHTRYPMGGERQTVKAVLDREVPTGGLPLDVGVVVMNVGTAAAVARAVVRGKPLTHRVVTVSGAGIKQPKNLLVPIGISYGELIDCCGGMTEDAARVVAGGPMMGFTIGDLKSPVTKGTSGLTILTGSDVKKSAETACVRCGRCVDVCPLGLVPTKMAHAAKYEDWELAKRYYLTACCECGCCAYACPASIPLVQLMRVGKAKMPRD